MEMANHVDLDGTMSEMAKDEVSQGITTLAIAVSNCAHAHGWWNDDDGNKIDRNMGEMLMLMTSELAEALESHRNSEPYLWYQHNFGPGLMHGPDEFSKPDETYSAEREFRGKLGKPEGVASEFADVIIRILDTCHTLDIPIIAALLDKHEYNISRPFRHGGKTC
jgi:NTP pyrophosphatase (non-canonical NTP hydrolase)